METIFFFVRISLSFIVSLSQVFIVLLYSFRLSTFGMGVVDHLRKFFKVF